MLGLYVISNNFKRHEYWSNDYGWTDLDSAESYTLEETERYVLPAGGKWVVCPNKYCFVRTITDYGPFNFVVKIRSDERRLDVVIRKMFKEFKERQLEYVGGLDYEPISKKEYDRLISVEKSLRD